MISFKKLWRNKRGNTIAIVAAAMPLFIGAAGLATDTIQWTLWKRQLQRAADSAAIAGVYDRENAVVAGSTTNTGNAVARDLSVNLHSFYALQTGKANCSGTCTVTYPANSGVITDQVSVTIAIQQPLSFSSFFMSTAPTITATSTAAAVTYGGNPCMRALNTTGTALDNSGNATIVAPTCIFYSNSASTNAAGAGGSSSVTAKAVAAVGGIQNSNNWIVQQYLPYSPALPDPFANVTPLASDMHCAVSSSTKKGVTTYTPLALTDGVDITTLKDQSGNPANCFSALSVGSNRTLAIPSTYTGPIYINGGNVNLQGAFSCTACTIVLTNIDPNSTTIGTYSSNAQATNNITAPTTGTFAGIAIYQDRRSTGNTDKVNGGSSSVIQGAIYFPKDTLQINGTGTAVSLCAMWVANNIVFTGNSSIAVSAPDDAACSGSGLPAAKALTMVRLVA
jgi:Flp pilus assembly protein TadG